MRASVKAPTSRSASTRAQTLKVDESSLIASFHAIRIGDRQDCDLSHTRADVLLLSPRSHSAWALPA